MTDTFSTKQRSEIMKAVKSKGNKSTEIKLIAIFKFHHLIGWRRNSNLAGHPDFVFPEKRIALFADGCFWHGCPKHATWPANRAAWWRRKILGNKYRDALVTRTLRRAGWRVLRVWEHELATKNEARLARRLAVFLVA